MRRAALALGALLLLVGLASPVAAAEGSVTTPVTFNDTEPSGTETTTTTVDVLPVESTSTTTTVELSAPTTVSQTPPTIAVSTTVSSNPPTVPTEVLGTTETNDGQLAVTGVDGALTAGAGLALIVLGLGATAASRRR
ncbi:MAG: hypothetical protein AAF548_01395 [Actinomycetota bacterium]